MDTVETKALTQSETFKWAILALVAFAAKRVGIDHLPTDVSGEVVNIVSLALDALVPVCIGLAIRARAKATQVIDRWF